MALSHSSVLSLQAVALAALHGAPATTTLDLELGHREVALVEVDQEGDTIGLVDLCLGLDPPLRGEVWCLGEAWQAQSYHEMMAHRGRIGALADCHAWPAHLSVAQVTITPLSYHSAQSIDDTVAAATALARRFGLPGLPTGGPETVHRDDLVRAACVRAFLGAPELVLIADPALEAMADVALAMARSIGEVQDRGGAVLWLLGSLAAPAARFVAADKVLRLGDRGLQPARRPS